MVNRNRIQPPRNQKRTMKTMKEELFRWACKEHATNCFLDKGTLREKALQLTRSHCLNGFKCSEKWLTQFLREHGFSAKQINRSGPMFADYRDWIDLMRSTIIKYKHRDLFHADELTMYSDMLPSRISQFNGVENPQGFESRNPRNRITILMGCNSSGTTKLPLLISGPYPSKISVKEHVYCYDKNCYIGDKLFRDWLTNVNDRMARSNRKILLFLRRNRAYALKDFVAGNVQLVYLPENFPPLLRPLRRDVFHYVKMIYRRRYAERLKERVSEWSIRDILSSLIDAWETIPQELIIFSFQRTHFRTDDCLLHIECDCWDSQELGISFRRFVTFDDDLSDKRVPYERNNQRNSYKLRTKGDVVIQINEDSFEKDVVTKNAKAANELSATSDANYRLSSERKTHVTEKSGHSRKKSPISNDKHRDAGASRLKEAIEGNRKRRRSQKRASSETAQFSAKDIENRRVPRDGDIKNSSFPTEDPSVALSRSIEEDAYKEDATQRHQEEANDTGESLRAVVDKALTVPSCAKANYAESLIDTFAGSQQTADDTFNPCQAKHLSARGDDEESKRANREDAVNPVESFSSEFDQPSTSANNWEEIGRSICERFEEDVEKQPLERESMKETELVEENREDGSCNLNLQLNVIDECCSSCMGQEVSSSCSKKRRRSASDSEEDSRNGEPEEKKAKTDEDWSKQYENTFVFGSPDANCSLDVQYEESIVDSCVFNVRPSPSPRE